jgi:hypothetical protein
MLVDVYIYTLMLACINPIVVSKTYRRKWRSLLYKNIFLDFLKDDVLHVALFVLVQYVC